MKTKILDVNQVLLDKETYPRLSPDFVTIARYANAMTSGAKFPPIVVASFEGKYYLVDGRHRMEATKIIKQTHIEAEVLNLKDKQEIYLEAIKRNITHGRQFSTQEVTNIMVTLEDWNMSKEQISQIVLIPADRIEAFVAKRVALVVGADGVQHRKALRKPLMHLAGSVQEDSTMNKQNTLIAKEQVHLIETIIIMLKNDWFDLNDKDVLDKLKFLQKSLLKLNLLPEDIEKPKKTTKVKSKVKKQ